MLRIFVAFPYDPEPLVGYREIYREIERSNEFVRFEFSDERIASDMVLNKIRSSIEECQFCLCDVTGWNPNVCLEFGLAIGMGRPVHILYRSARTGLLGRMIGRPPETPDLPIDMRGYDRLDYQDAQSLTLGVQRLIDQELATPDPGMAAGIRLLREKIYKLIESHPGLKKTEIASRMGMELADINPAIEVMLRNGRIDRRGRYQNTVFYAAGTAPLEDAPPSTQRKEADGGGGEESGGMRQQSNDRHPET